MLLTVRRRELYRCADLQHSLLTHAICRYVLVGFRQSQCRGRIYTQRQHFVTENPQISLGCFTLNRFILRWSERNHFRASLNSCLVQASFIAKTLKYAFPTRSHKWKSLLSFARISAQKALITLFPFNSSRVFAVIQPRQSIQALDCAMSQGISKSYHKCKVDTGEFHRMLGWKETVLDAPMSIHLSCRFVGFYEVYHWQQ